MAPKIWAAPTVEDVTSGNPEAMRTLREYLQTFGYLDRDKDSENLGGEISEFDDYAALRGLQHFLGLPDSGNYNKETQNALEKPRCGVPDNDNIASYIASGHKWNKKVITWKLLNASPDLGTSSFAKARQQIKAAFDEWDRYMPNNSFAESTGPTADIMISFVRLNHNDGYPFDGPGKVLAHAFYPATVSGALAGDVHLDEDETWKEVFLQQVALHEIGHSLGLGHSNDRNAVMYPTFSAKSNLEPDDIAGIRNIYP